MILLFSVLYIALFSIMFFAAINFEKSDDNEMINILIRKGRDE